MSVIWLFTTSGIASSLECYLLGHVSRHTSWLMLSCEAFQLVASSAKSSSERGNGDASECDSTETEKSLSAQRLDAFQAKPMWDAGCISKRFPISVTDLSRSRLRSLRWWMLEGSVKPLRLGCLLRGHVAWTCTVGTASPRQNKI